MYVKRDGEIDSIVIAILRILSRLHIGGTLIKIMAFQNMALRTTLK